jgi:pilus assembly protein CpaB
MNTRAFTLALIISIFAMFMVYTYIDDQKSEVIKRYGTQSSVVVAKEDINAYELIDDSKIRVASVPKSFLMPGHFKTMKELENTMATVPVLKGEQITKPRVTYPGMSTGLSRQVSVGKRAMAITVTERQAVGKLIKPGDRVDIITSIDYSSGQKDKQKIQTILQDVLVLSTGLSMTNSIPVIGVKTPREIRKMNLETYANYNTVSLELDPYEAQKLAYLLTYSAREPFLTLRNNSDQKIVRIESTGIFDVLGDEEREAARAYFAEQYQRRN